jgi:hypothetical protein
MRHSKLYTRTEPARKDADILGTTLAVAGVVAGVAALVSFVGAVAQWIRFDALGYPRTLLALHLDGRTRMPVT